MSAVIYVRVAAIALKAGDHIRIAGGSLRRTVKSVRRGTRPGLVVIEFEAGLPWEGASDFTFERMEVV